MIDARYTLSMGLNRDAYLPSANWHLKLVYWTVQDWNWSKNLDQTGPDWLNRNDSLD